MEKDLLLEQKHEGHRQTGALHIGQPNFGFFVDKRGMLDRNSTIDRASKLVV